MKKIKKEYMIIDMIRCAAKRREKGGGGREEVGGKGRLEEIDF